MSDPMRDEDYFDLQCEAEQYQPGDTLPAPPPPSSPLDPLRSGDFNADERTFTSFCLDCGELHNVRCTLAEFDNTDDTYLRWFVRCRDDHCDEEILVEQHRHTYELKAYQQPKRFHSAAMGFVGGEPECLSEEF